MFIYKGRYGSRGFIAFRNQAHNVRNKIYKEDAFYYKCISKEAINYFFSLYF